MEIGLDVFFSFDVLNTLYYYQSMCNNYYYLYYHVARATILQYELVLIKCSGRYMLCHIILIQHIIHILLSSIVEWRLVKY